MNFFKNFDWSIKSIAKVIGIGIVGMIAISIIISLMSMSVRTVFDSSNKSYQYMGMDEGMGGGFDNNYLRSEKMAMPMGMPIPPQEQYVSGGDAEEFEIKEYNGTIRTRKLEKTCETIQELKAKDYIIFERSDQNQTNCFFRFKVEKEKSEEIVAIIKELKPENFNERVQTIKKAIEGVDTELDILQKRLSANEQALTEAQKAYDEIGRAATRKGDIETLAKTIDNKLKLIGDLTKERMSIKERIDRIAKNRSDLIDQLKYTIFNINIYEDLIVDWKEIKDSWKYETKRFVQNINEVLQGVTVNLFNFMIRFAQVVIYLFVSLYLLKYVWKATKLIWKGKDKKKKK